MTLLSIGAWYRDLRSGNYPDVNRRFTWLVFAGPPVIGSVVTVLYNAGAIWCAAEVARGRASLSRSPTVRAVTVALYALCFALIASALINPGPATSLAQLIGVVAFLLFPFSYAVWRVADKQAIVQACIMGSVVACLGGLAIAVVQVHFLSASRGEGGAGNSLIFANLIVLSAGVALTGVFRYRGRDQLLCLVAYAAGALALVYSASRGPLAVLLVHAVIVAFIHTPGRRLQLVGATLAAVAALLALLTLTNITPLAGRIEALFDNWNDVFENGKYTSSLGLRFAVWDVGIQLILEKPILGHGAGNMGELIREGLLADYGISRSFSHFHNAFISTAVEGGIAALAALLAAVLIPAYAALRTLAKSDSETQRFGATLILIYVSMFFIAGMTNLVVRHDIMDAVFMIFLVVGLTLIVDEPAGSAQTKASS